LAISFWLAAYSFRLPATGYQLARVECALLRANSHKRSYQYRKNLFVKIASKKNALSQKRIIQPLLIKWLISEPNQPGAPGLSKRSEDREGFGYGFRLSAKTQPLQIFKDLLVLYQ